MTEFTSTESSQLLSSSPNILQTNEATMEETGSGKESDEANEILETRSQCGYSETASTAVSMARGDTGGAGGAGGGGGGGGGGAGGVTRAEPLSAKQQVALWLTRTSTQEIYSELTMENLKSWVYPHSQPSRHSRHKQPLCGPSSSSRSNNHQDIHRNFSTKSLLESSHSQGNYYEDGGGNIRKCETVLALSEESHGGRPRVSKAKSKSKASLCSSRMSLFKRPASKCVSEITQPFPGIRPTNRLR